MIPLCLDQGVGVIPYSPLARGLLAGNRTPEGAPHTTRAAADPLAASRLDANRDADLEVVAALRTVAAERGVPPARVALAWLLGRPSVTAPVTGATKPHHVDDAVAAVGLRLTADETRRLEAPYRPHQVIGHG